METQSAPLVGENLLLLGFYLGTSPGLSAHFINFVALNSFNRITTSGLYKGEGLKRSLWQLLHLFIYETSRGGLLRSVHEISSSDGGHWVWGCPAKLNLAFPTIISVSSISFVCSTSHGSVVFCKRIFKESLAVSCLLHSEGNIRMCLMYPLRDI